MGCLYSDNEENCSLWEKDNENSPRGADDDGLCVVSDDLEPSNNCESYESDWQCYECGVDLNINECECEED